MLLAQKRRESLMKLYFYSSRANINSYFIVNENANSKDGILLDPTHINEHFIEKIESEGVLLKLVLLTNANHPYILHGICSLQKIYNFQTFSLSAREQMKRGQSSIYESGSFQIETYPIKMNGKDVCMYKIGMLLFTGLPFLDSFLLPSDPSFLEKIERERLKEFLLNLDEATVCFPLSGPPFTIKTFKFYAET